MLPTILKSFDTVDIIATKYSFVTLSVTGIVLIGIAISAAPACGLSFGNKVIYEIIKQKYNNYKKPNQKE